MAAIRDSTVYDPKQYHTPSCLLTSEYVKPHEKFPNLAESLAVAHKCFRE